MRIKICLDTRKTIFITGNLINFFYILITRFDCPVIVLSDNGLKKKLFVYNLGCNFEIFILAILIF
jgi:hypothetical protein